MRSRDDVVTDAKAVLNIEQLVRAAMVRRIPSLVVLASVPPRRVIIVVFKSIKRAGYSDEDILSMWETIVHSQPPTSRAWDAPHAHSFAD